MSDTTKLLFFGCISLLVISAIFFRLFQNQLSFSNELQEDLKRSRVSSQRNFWFFYYTKPEDQKFGIDELEDTIDAFNWSMSYQKFEFDCSEMSAYLERYLENLGWNASIAVGFEHAWLLVETSEGNYTPVEAPVLEVINDTDEFYDYYFDYDHLFKNIYSANEAAFDEFNWWIPYGLYTDSEWKEHFKP